MKRRIGVFSLSLLLALCLGSVTAHAADGRGSDPSLPAWYPDDPQGFVFYHDESAPRVVDAADLFSDAEERQMEARIAELRAELGRDVVIYTDTTSYGLSHAVLAADFYDFNGYGYGDEREGVCLFLCMDPDDRGGWVCCTGSETRALYTEAAANELDDVLYGYLGAGAYGEGVADWIENIRTLYRKGMPFAPEWYPDDPASFVRRQDAAAHRLADDVNLLTEAERADLAARAAAISKKYGVDVVIHTARSVSGLTLQEYSDLYFYYGGYGLGPDYDGIALTVFKRPGYYAAMRTTASGSVQARLTETNNERLYDRCIDTLENEEYYEGISLWLTLVEKMLKTGRVPRSLASWLGSGGLGVLAGSLFGGGTLAGAKRKMRTPQTRENADAYLAAGGLRIRGLGDQYLYTSTSRRYSPVKEERSSGHSSGGSSFSHSYSGSSGSSHSGSGRRF